jgi:flagellar motor switch protein FliM
LHDAFARNFGASLSGFLRTIIEVKVATCEQMTYSEFIASLPNPTAFNLLSTNGLEGQMCLEVSPLIIYPIIDRLLGGTSVDLFIPQRPMTLIESRLISNLTVRALQALSESWAGVKELKFKVDATESNPQLVQIVPPNEVVVVVSFELKMSNRAGTMNLCIPYTVIEPVMEELSSQSWFAASRNQRSKALEKDLGTALTKAAVSVTGILAETTITMKNLLEMQVGDVIMTEHVATKNVVMCVEQEKKFAAQIGQFKGSRALRIVREIGPDDRL